MHVIYRNVLKSMYMYLSFISYFPQETWLIERSPPSRKVECSNPSRDRTKSLKHVVTAQCQTLGITCKCHRSSEMTIINGCPVSQYVWHAKEPVLLNGHKCRAKIKICSPSAAMVTSPNEWKILEWDEKLQTNKQLYRV